MPPTPFYTSTILTHISTDLSCVRRAGWMATPRTKWTRMNARHVKTKPTMQISNFFKDSSRPLERNACFKKTCPYECARCKRGLRSTEHLTPKQLSNHRSARKTPIVCKACSNLGYTGQSPDSYICQTCCAAKASVHFQEQKTN